MQNAEDTEAKRYTVTKLLCFSYCNSIDFACLSVFPERFSFCVRTVPQCNYYLRRLHFMLKRNLVHTAAVFLHICTSGCCLQITAHKIKQIEPHYFRHHTENECALTSRKGLSSQTSKANSELFIDTKCSSSSIQQVKQIHSPIQTRLKAQGNLKLVTTNVRLNSSSYYLRGEREREWPKII